jgi:phage baseplate assembly protein W
MAVVSYEPGLGINRRTGQVMDGWAHVVQSLEVIFTTRFGERVMREWFGSAVPYILGRNMIPETFIAYFSAICGAIELWEPRFRITQIVPLEVDRLGRARFRIEGTHYPRGHLGDMTPAGTRRIVAYGGSGADWTVREAA